MPRYYFHVSGLSSFNDTIGAELKNASAAWSVAVVSCGEILTDLDGMMPDRSEVRITVKDENERIVAIVRFTGERQITDPQFQGGILRSGADDVRERMVSAIDGALDWIKDVHDPEDYGPFASDIANAALVSLEDGDRLGENLVVRRETIQ